PDAVEALNMALKAVRRLNKSKIIEPDLLEEHMISGATAARVSIAHTEQTNRDEGRIDTIDQTRLFYNLDLANRRLDGLRMIGYLHDMTADELVASFAIDNAGDYDEGEAERLKEIYRTYESKQEDLSLDYGFTRADSVDFLNTYD